MLQQVLDNGGPYELLHTGARGMTVNSSVICQHLPSISAKPKICFFFEDDCLKLLLHQSTIKAKEKKKKSWDDKIKFGPPVKLYLVGIIKSEA